jgi:hypothetical protein
MAIGLGFGGHMYEHYDEKMEGGRWRKFSIFHSAFITLIVFIGMPAAPRNC